MWKNFVKEVSTTLNISSSSLNKLRKKSTEAISEYLTNKLLKSFKEGENKLGDKIWGNIVKAIFLSTIDKYWTEHLTSIDNLREGINLRGYAQLDPLVEYKNEAFSMFERLVANINAEVTRRIFEVKMEEEQGPITQIEPEKAENLTYKSASSVSPFQSVESNKTVSSKTDDSNNASEGGLRVIQAGVKKPKIGRNDPCWCGSGKKWKKCHYPELPPPGWKKE